MPLELYKIDAYSELWTAVFAGISVLITLGLLIVAWRQLSSANSQLTSAVDSFKAAQKSVEQQRTMANFEIEFELNRRKEKLASEMQEIEIIAADAETVKKQADALTAGSSEQAKLLTEYSRKQAQVEVRHRYRNESLENYFNAFDRLCYYILQGQLAEEDFRLEYREMLFRTVKEYQNDKVFDKTTYRNMVKLHEKWKDT